MRIFGIFALVAALTVTGCKKKQKPANDVQVTTTTSTTEPTTPTPPEEDPVISQLKSNFSRVFFDLDSAALSQDSIDILAENAAILQKNPDVSVRIEGHADERGTVDYNLALAAERARKVQDTLTGMGVAANKLSTVSYGEERPLAEASTESAWSKNRRAEFTVVRDPTNAVTGTTETPAP